MRMMARAALMRGGFCCKPRSDEKQPTESLHKPLDHVVLPVADLGVARARLTALGFTVAPDGLHPFGTANCCVYLADGTFLEPLAVGDPRKGERVGPRRQCLHGARRRLSPRCRQGRLLRAGAGERRCGRRPDGILRGRVFGRQDPGILAAVRRCGGRQRHRFVPPGLRRRSRAPRHLSLHLPAAQRAESGSRRAAKACQWRGRHRRIVIAATKPADLAGPADAQAPARQRPMRATGASRSICPMRRSSP